MTEHSWLHTSCLHPAPCRAQGHSGHHAGSYPRQTCPGMRWDRAGSYSVPTKDQVRSLVSASEPSNRRAREGGHPSGELLQDEQGSSGESLSCEGSKHHGASKSRAHFPQRDVIKSIKSSLGAGGAPPGSAWTPVAPKPPPRRVSVCFMAATKVSAAHGVTPCLCLRTEAEGTARRTNSRTAPKSPPGSAMTDQWFLFPSLSFCTVFKYSRQKVHRLSDGKGCS